jgi:hypothetical protein
MNLMALFNHANLGPGYRIDKQAAHWRWTQHVQKDASDFSVAVKFCVENGQIKEYGSVFERLK